MDIAYEMRNAVSSIPSKKVFASMNRALVTLLVLFMTPLSSFAVDESPIEVEVVPAFAELEFPRPEETPHFRPVVITHAKDGSNRIFFVSQQGAIYVAPNRQDVKEAKTFLDIESNVVYRDNKNEEGMLGLAFHPNYRENGFFYVYYTTKDADQTSVISRFSVSKSDPDKADPDSEVELMRLPQPYWNHNGGSIEFGPDGYLYIGLGDGGAGRDPHGNGQNTQTMLGSILRIDIDKKDAGKAYAIPKDNPFADGKGGLPEIYAYGLRNVWRLSFDSRTGHFWVADVGQDLWEEINIVEKGGNYGWNLREGMHPFGKDGVEKSDDLIDPIWEYDHKTGKSITGGHVYRGSKVPKLDGYYLYADYVTGRFWALKYNYKTETVEENREIKTPADTPFPIMAFGTDENGEVYCGDAFGKLYRFQAKK